MRYHIAAATHYDPAQGLHNSGIMAQIQPLPITPQQARAEILKHLFSAQETKGGAIIASPEGENILIALDCAAGQGKKVFILDAKAKVSQGALYDVEENGESELGLLVKPIDSITEKPQFVEEGLLDRALLLMVKCASERPEECEFISAEKLELRYDTIKNLKELAADRGVLPTPFGALFIDEVPDDTNLAGKSKFRVRLGHGDVERTRTLFSSEWQITSDHSLTTITGTRTLAELDLICLVAAERHKYSMQRKAA